MIKNPIDKDPILDIYRSLGISEAFIQKVLLYASGRPIVNVVKFIKDYGITPKTYDEPPDRIANNLKTPSYRCGILDGVYDDIYIPIIRYQIGWEDI